MSIIQNLRDIILFRAKPEDVPYDPSLTFIAIFTAWITAYVHVRLNTNFSQPFLIVLVQILTFANLISLFLIAANKKERIPQTLLAVFGVFSLFKVATLIFISLRLYGAYIGLEIWKFIVMIYIVRHAMNIGKPQAFFLALGVELSVGFVTTVFFPELMQKTVEAMQQSQTVTN